ncbi:PREDICTED: pectinesterase 2-like [Lupinus angustifolius]|uniref:pectinesterase 2-like n=1 Tax=Lupinus angustifolius TaxID=3871 RepID=UPI00092F98AC|nr:PREDICTED: pectinesterase 2-like [Lupinus angustifolius]
MFYPGDAVSGEGFIAKDITFENTAGPQKHQAVALRSGADHSVFYRCSFKGYQDTLYVHTQRQFYRDSDIYGTVDFIFGDAITVLQNCNIYVRKPMSNQQNTVTAQGRTDPNENTGIIIHNSRITASGDLKPIQSNFKTFLGRPWQKYSRTVILKSNLDGLVNPLGWIPWSGSFALSTLYYGEYMNIGAGANTKGRVNWVGFHVINDPSEAVKFSVGDFLNGDSWIPGSGVPFDVGL